MPKHVFPSDNGIPYTVGRYTHPIFSYCGDEEYLRHLVHSARQNLWRLDLSSPSTILRMISSFLFHVRDTSIPYHYTKYFYGVKFLHLRKIFYKFLFLLATLTKRPFVQRCLYLPGGISIRYVVLLL